MPERGMSELMSSASGIQSTGTEPVTERYVPDTVAADLIGTMPATMRRWRYEGRGPRYVKMGSSVRYKVSVLRLS